MEHLEDSEGPPALPRDPPRAQRGLEAGPCPPSGVFSTRPLPTLGQRHCPWCQGAGGLGLDTSRQWAAGGGGAWGFSKGSLDCAF